MRKSAGINKRLWLGVLFFSVMALGSIRYWVSLPSQIGLDLYQFWGVAKAQRESGYRLGSPYGHPEQYKAELDQMASASGDDTLVQALASRSTLDLTGTPFLYYAFGLIRWPYAPFLDVIRGLQFLSFSLATFLVIRSIAPSAGTLASFLFSIALSAAFDPLILDLAVANLSSLQLLHLCLIGVILARVNVDSARIEAAMAAALAVWLVFLTLIKPNVIGATLLLLASLLSSATHRGRAAAMIAAALSALLFLVLPCVLFGSMSVWTEWLHGPLHEFSGPSILTALGNYSLAAFFLRYLGWPALASAEAAFLVLVAATSAVWLLTFKSNGMRLLEVARRPLLAFRQPFILVGIGMIAVLALSPIVWSHYLVLLLPSALFCCFSDSATPAVRLFGWFSLALMADVPRRIFQLSGFIPHFWLDLFHATSWLPAWIGMAAYVVGTKIHPERE